MASVMGLPQIAGVRLYRAPQDTLVLCLSERFLGDGHLYVVTANPRLVRMADQVTPLRTQVKCALSGSSDIKSRDTPFPPFRSPNSFKAKP